MLQTFVACWPSLVDTLQIAWDIARIGAVDAHKQIDRLLERTLRRAVEPA